MTSHQTSLGGDIHLPPQGERVENPALVVRAPVGAVIGYAFNWHYVDDTDIAFVNSGSNPVRLAGTN
ncbi:hypothetical protein ABZ635_27115, partial [Nocardiopsis sp. NPDC007018]|uniref:hypothetical protein n=1 Tax=Nocardiopsis sp. NPDC007018 TaxID=3155721 RepID=UPI0033DBBDFE